MPEPKKTESEPAGEPTPSPAEAPPAATAGDPESLGDAGKRALDAERQARREAEARLKELEPLAEKARELEESQKSEVERANEKATAAEREAQSAKLAALRLEVALDAAPEGLSISKVRKLAARLQGEDREALEADAEELFAEFAGTTTNGPPGKTPRENLRPGTTDPEADPPVDHEALAEKILERHRI